MPFWNASGASKKVIGRPQNGDPYTKSQERIMTLRLPIPPILPLVPLGVFLLLYQAASHSLAATEFQLKATSGDFARTDAVVKMIVGFEPNATNPNSPDLPKLDSGSRKAWTLKRADQPSLPPVVVEVEPLPKSSGWQLTWVEAGQWPAGQERQWILKTEPPADFKSPWSWKSASDGQLELHHSKKGLVFRYNQKPVNQPGLPPTQLRGAYIHPFMTPSGKLATGDFSPFHTHHRGFFLAYAKTKVDTLAPDFWNIHAGTAKIVANADHVQTIAGPVTASLKTHHDWQLRDKSKPGEDSGKTVLEESWTIDVYDVPNQPAWIWDLTSTQTPLGQDLEIVKHRYGGMAYRGPEPFVKGKLDVLTSEGHNHRTKADQKPAKWFDLTGPVANGSETYVGAVMCDHPSNIRFPNVVRIHPVTLPFFSFVPAYNENLKLQAGQGTTWKYRTMVHDGRPDQQRDEALFQDFSTPVKVEFKSR